MIDYFNRTLEIITPRFDDEGNEIEHVVISDSIQSLIGLTIRTSITETEGYYNFSKAISYRFKYANIVLSSYLTITISILTLIILLFIFIPKEWLNLANILALILWNS